MNLIGKTILITGVTSGIGLELLNFLHKENKVIILGRNIQKLESLTKKFTNLDTYLVDLENLNQIQASVEKILIKYPNIDLLINNAAIQYTEYFLDENFNFNNIAREIQVNLTAPIQLISLTLPLLLKKDLSIILNINSGLGLVPKTSSAVYCATKSALNSFSSSLDYQLEKTNIEVFQAFLPLVDTPMTKGRGQKKISSKTAAEKIILGLEHNLKINYIGKVKLLGILNRLFPKIASSLMKRS